MHVHWYRLNLCTEQKKLHWFELFIQKKGKKQCMPFNASAIAFGALDGNHLHFTCTESVFDWWIRLIKMPRRKKYRQIYTHSLKYWGYFTGSCTNQSLFWLCCSSVRQQQVNSVNKFLKSLQVDSSGSWILTSKETSPKKLSNKNKKVKVKNKQRRIEKCRFPWRK